MSPPSAACPLLAAAASSRAQRFGETASRQIALFPPRRQDIFCSLSCGWPRCPEAAALLRIPRCGRAAVGIPLHLEAALLVLLAVNLAVVIPAAPGNLGS